jgi:hypothetical protein
MTIHPIFTVFFFSHKRFPSASLTYSVFCISFLSPLLFFPLTLQAQRVSQLGAAAADEGVLKSIVATATTDTSTVGEGGGKFWKKGNAEERIKVEAAIVSKSTTAEPTAGMILFGQA